MSNPAPTPAPAEGGCYVIDATGNRRRVEEPTRNPEAAPAAAPVAEPTHESNEE